MLSFRLTIVAMCIYLAGFLMMPRAWAGENGVVKLELPDAAAVGMGDAFVGEADRASAIYYNPAGIVQLETPEISGDLTWVQPHLHYESSAQENGPDYTANMKDENFIFPSIFFASPVIKNKLYLGVGESSDFGGGYSWEPNSFSQYQTIKDSMVNYDYRIVAAYKITDQWSLAAGATNDQSDFEHLEAINQGAAGNGDALFKANDDAWGFDLGTLFKLNAQNQLGLDYKSPIHHTYDGNVYFSNLYAGGLGYVLGGSSVSTKAVQKFTMPQSVTLGYSLKPTPKWTINFDLEWTDWSQYKDQITSYPNLSPVQQAVLAGSSTSSRNWTSIWSESIGAQYAVTEQLRLRLGYQHHESPVPQDTFDTEFPDSGSNSVTVGLGYDITKNLTIDLAYVADFYDTRTVTNTVGENAGAFLSGKYSAFVNVGMVTITYKF